jgi:hypothetical protein
LALALSGLLLDGGCTEQGAFLPADEETDRKLRAIVGAEPS